MQHAFLRKSLQKPGPQASVSKRVLRVEKVSADRHYGPGLLIAAGQNLKRLLAATGWGRRHAPCGSLVAMSMEPGQLSAVSG